MKKPTTLAVALALGNLLLAGCGTNASVTAPHSVHQPTPITRNAPIPVTYRLYHNARWAFSLKVPTQWKTQDIPADGDGASWTLQRPANSIPQITVYGEGNNLGNPSHPWTPRTFPMGSHIHVRQRKVGTHGMIATGVEVIGGRKIPFVAKVIFQKTRHVGASVLVLTITYPPNQNRQYQSLVTTVTSSFTGGTPPQSR